MKALRFFGRVINISIRFLLAGFIILWHLLMTVVGAILTAINS